jgi:hypothetical protein
MSAVGGKAEASIQAVMSAYDPQRTSGFAGMMFWARVDRLGASTKMYELLDAVHQSNLICRSFSTHSSTKSCTLFERRVE